MLHNGDPCKQKGQRELKDWEIDLFEKCQYGQICKFGGENVSARVVDKYVS